MNEALRIKKGVRSEEIGFKGIAKEFDDGKYKVTYFDLNQERQTEWFEESELEEFKANDKRQYNKPYIKYEPLKLKVLYHTDNPELEQTTIGNWIDLRSAIDVELKQFEFKIIPLGISIQLPKGFEAEIKPRSSTYKNFGIIQTNSVGCVDETYAGNNDVWGMPALAMRDTKINKGDRICQFRINRVMPKLDIEKVETLENEDRGGFGSTGVK